MHISTYESQYPQYCFDFSQPTTQQPRIYGGEVLAALPEELTPYPIARERGGRGRANRNQTRTHYQCYKCKRLLRNDFFHTSPSLVARNVIASRCKPCTKEKMAVRYLNQTEDLKERREKIWRYLAPCCTNCGFDQHISALDMHHLGEKDGNIAALITDLMFKVTSAKAEKLLRESKQCVPLCSNCHRMLHAGVIELSSGIRPLNYDLIELLTALKEST